MRENMKPEIHSQSRWLTTPRLVWIIVVLLYIGTYFAAARVYLTQASDVSQLIPGGWTEAEFRSTLAQAGLSLEAYALFSAWLLILFSTPSWVVGAFIFWRKSNDRMAFLISTFFILLGTAPAVFEAPIKTLIGTHPVWQTISDGISFPWLICLPLIFYLFPDGQWTPRWTRWMYLIWVVYMGITTIGSSSLRFSEAYQSVHSFVLIGLMATFPLAQIYRYLRVSGQVERQQIKWIVFGLAFGTAWVLVTYLTGYIFPSLREPGLAGLAYYFMVSYVQWAVFLLAIPISFAIAILRSRLWDIDLLIRRTLQYSVLSGLLALTYFGLIVTLQGIFTAVSGQSSSPALVLSTLAIAGLFLPLRRRVQDFIDRRFFRKKYDAAKVVAEFAATARDETDLDQLTARLVEVVQETMQPESVTLWLRPMDDGRPLTAEVSENKTHDR
jgi:hypothetical protein